MTITNDEIPKPATVIAATAIADPVSQKDLLNHTWRLGIAIIAAAVFAWQASGFEIARARDDVKSLDTRMTNIQERVTRVEVTLERMNIDLNNAATKLALIEQRLGDIAMRLDAGPMGGPASVPQRSRPR